MTETNNSPGPPVTDLLNAWAATLPRGDAKVFEVVYDRLREIAAAHMSGQDRHLLQTTVVLNEAFLKLARSRSLRWNDREHFFAHCSRVMRHVLVDLAKSRRRLKRGPNVVHVSLEEPRIGGREDRRDDVLAVHQALSALEEIDPERARVVELRYFGGMTPGEIATALNLSESTIHRRWRLARAWLFDFIRQDSESRASPDPGLSAEELRRGSGVVVTA